MATQLATAALAAPGALLADATPDPAALWAVYLAAAEKAAQAWVGYRMQRGALGTDGNAGFVYGSAYSLQQTADAAYDAYQLAQHAAHPGASG
jgi:hypothetical protein